MEFFEFCSIYFSKFKALVDSEKFRVIAFKYSAKNVHSERRIFTSKHDSTCHRKNSELSFLPINYRYGHKKNIVIIYEFTGRGCQAGDYPSSGCTV